MGHKGKMLPILSEILTNESKNSKRIADPFCGSGVVSWHLAENFDKIIIAGDLQSYAAIRAASVITRTTKIEHHSILIKSWFNEANKLSNAIFDYFPNHIKSIDPSLNDHTQIKNVVFRSRKFTQEILPDIFRKLGGKWAISKAYGGYYYSPYQSIIFDSLRQTLPKDESFRLVALSALIDAASRCSASPGHTAQPFQPTEKAAKYIMDAWKRDVYKYVEKSIYEISEKYSKNIGESITGDYALTIDKLSEGDLVFADPPYSGVHYSRFYHVLETLALGKEFTVSGQGRYPDQIYRPVSTFSRKTESSNAADDFLKKCSDKNVNVVLTFPENKSSNGLSAKDFMNIGKKYFSKIEYENFESEFSTLGGNSIHRESRVKSSESIVIFRL
jgi:adenine-specific DNA methylase